MTLNKMLKLAAVAVPLAFGSAAVPAAVINTAGGAMNFDWSYDTGAGVTITGSGSIASSLVNGDDLSLAVTLTNTTALVSGNMSLMSFGFGIDPDATSVSISGGSSMTGASLTSDPPPFPGLALIEVCAWAGNSCAGGPVNDGIQAGGGTDSFTLLVAGSYGSSVTIEPIGLQFQGTVGSFQFYVENGDTPPPPPPPPGQVPEPSTLAIFGLGLLALFGARRRRAMA